MFLIDPDEAWRLVKVFGAILAITLIALIIAIVIID